MARRSRHVRTSEEKNGKMTEQAKCDICCSSSFQESLLSCHSCITVQHSFCLDTPLVAYPDRRWICPACTTTGSRLSRKRRRTMTSSTGTRHEAPNGKMEVEVGKSEVINSTTSVTSIAADQVSSLSNARSSGGKRSRVSPQAASAGSAHNISVKTLSDGAAETSSQLRGAQTATTLSEGIPEGEGNEEPTVFVAETNDHLLMLILVAASEDPGSTITIFCRRDFRRYLRWKRQKLASQDDEKRREEKTRARKTFSSIIANALC